MKLASQILWILCPFLLLGQVEQNRVVAENGDGIFSILRKQGLDPVKYYEEFVELNQDNLKNGSELHLGREYIIPYAADSYKNTAIEVSAKSKTEEPIFNDELDNISPKSSRLKNAVIYLISGNNLNNSSSSINSITDAITLNLAEELMVHGAQVYLIKSDLKEKQKPFKVALDQNTEGAMAEISQMREYVEVINKKYLKHQGKYQRLLITRVRNDDIKSKHCKVSVYHHNNSENGRSIASNIQRIFKENSIKRKSFKEYTDVFTDKNNLYLAKNALPAITLIDIDKENKPTIDDVILVDSNQALLSNLIASGVLIDYADLEIDK